MSGERFSALIEAARAGDEGAWSEIYAELAPAVLGYLRGSGAPGTFPPMDPSFT